MISRIKARWLVTLSPGALSIWRVFSSDVFLVPIDLIANAFHLQLLYHYKYTVVNLLSLNYFEGGCAIMNREFRKGEHVDGAFSFFDIKLKQKGKRLWLMWF
ncbi:hypothetical protein ES708_12733 [subsurface metagenome]